MSVAAEDRYCPAMARLPRFFVPDTPQHVIQRGNNRQAIFVSPADRAFFKDCLMHAARRNGVAIHAYVLMTNHVHLLVTPEAATSLPRTMQSVGRVYVRYFNSTRERSGTLWDGRYKATIVDSDRYLLACMRYIEQNPVRAGMAERPEDYRWSSHRANGFGAPDPLVTPHRNYQALGTSPAARRSSYLALFDQPVADEETHAIRDATQFAWALGSAAFRRGVERLGRRAERVPLGRPAGASAAGGTAERPHSRPVFANAEVESDPTSRKVESDSTDQ
jgi:putative transposase